MARELVLVRKSQFEHLVKLANESVVQEEQSGGQSENNRVDIPSPDSYLKTENDTSDVGTGLGDDSGKEKISKEENDNKTGEEKPRLYVNKPLSEMPFDTSKVSVSDKKKRDKAGKTTLNKTKLQSVSKRKRKPKARWINYLI